MDQSRNGNSVSCSSSSSPNPSLINADSHSSLPTLPGMPASISECSVAGQKLSQGCETPHKTTCTPHMGSSRVLEQDHRDPHRYLRHTFCACVCFVQWVKSTNSRTLQEKEGARRWILIFLCANKMQIMMQSMHAANETGKHTCTCFRPL